ncbi:MAG: bifunctional precorrin-2 dehydrogenase/sirohydrochlorin ferrochelatase [Nitrospinota bacterium]
MPGYYPVMMDLKGRDCVAVGGGEVAARKVEMLISCGANVTVVAPELEKSLQELVSSHKVKHINTPYRKGHLNGACLVIASTDNTDVNRAVYDDASAAGIPVNVVDVPELCSFIVPAVVERGDLILAVSTSGKSPAMAKRIRKELQKQFGDEYAAMLRLMGEARRILMEREPDLDKRMRILTDIANSDLMDRVKTGEKVRAEELVEGALGK